MTAAAPAPCDAAAIRAREAGKTANPAGVLAATVLGSSLAFIDGSVVNVALPAIAGDLDAGSTGVQWIVNSYLLPLTALVLLGGALADRIGRRRIFLAGLALFTLASIGCLLAPGLEALIAARAGQGVGAALLVPASLAILGSSFDGEARGRAIGTWAAAGAAAGAVGPIVGGWLVDTVGWRSIFALLLPIGGVAFALGWRFLAKGDVEEDAKRPDWTGAALATLGLGGMTWGLTILSQGGAGWPALAVGAVFFWAFLWVERRRGDEAMMPLSLFATRTFSGVTLLTLLLYAALGGLLLLVPILLIGRGWAATAAGAAMLPLPILMGLGSRAMGRLAERIGPRLPLTAGPLIAGAGFALFARVPDGAIDFWTHILPPMALIGAGMTIAVAPLTSTVMAAVDKQHAGAASGVSNATARFGGLLATALIGLVLGEGGESVSAPAFRIAALAAGAVAALGAAAAFALIAPAPKPPRPA